MSSNQNENIEAIYPLSPLQKGMLFHTVYSPKSGVYFQQLRCVLTGELDVSALKGAWQRVIDRHQILRTGFVWEGQTKPLQVVRRKVTLPWQQQDWRGVTPQEQDERVERYLKEDREAGFKLSRPPLMRCLLAQRNVGAYEFVWSYHHILLDGWSIALLLKEVFALYEAFRQGQDLQLEQPRPYQEYIGWLKKQDVEKAEAFWRQSLTGFNAPTTLSTRRERSALPVAEGQPSEFQVELESGMTEALRAVARQHQLTMNTVVQGMWGLLLSHYSASRDVVFGVVVAGRPESLSGVESMLGLFVNTLPMRVQTGGREPLLSWLQRLQRQQVESREYAYSALVDIQGWSEVPRGQPLFECIYGFENYPVERFAGEQGESVKVVDVRFVEQTNYLLNLMVWETDKLALKLFYDGRRFDAATVSRMMGHLRTLLEGVATHLALPVSELSLLTGDERRRQLVEWNDTRREYPDEACIHELFEAQVQRTPHAVALICGNSQLTYQELNTRANLLAHHLRHLGVAPESLIALCLERSLEMVVSLLAILKAGAAYLPLDPAYPLQRLAQVLTDARPQVLITRRHLAERLPVNSDAALVYLDSLPASLDEHANENCHAATRADNLAYVIYTSGSTGTPKGVMTRHSATLNRCQWMWQTFPFDSDEVCCQKTSLSFVDSVWEIWGPLLCGIPNVIIADEEVRDAERLVESLSAHGVTRVVLVPSLLRAMLDSRQDLGDKLKRLKYWVLSGEALPAELCERFAQRLPESRLINLYGSSEVSADVSYYEVEEDVAATGIVPIGRPISNTRLYVLGEEMELVGFGVAGELYVGGAGLSRGYLHRPEQTAERFVPDPYGEEAGGRLYRTGDIARYLAGGELEYVGRRDGQVKIRGFRIELGEIEAVLQQHERVRECVVVAREEEGGDKRLVCYVVPEEGSTGVSSGEWRSYLRERLPEYMVPSVFVELEEMPLTPNGKVNRRALPAPDDATAGEAHRYVAPRTPVEELIAGIWAEVLATGSVGAEDNFFDRGGHSLLAMQVVSRLREASGVEVAVRKLFERPTVSGLAEEVEQLLRGEVGEVEEIERVGREGELPLSFAQQRLWLAEQLSPLSSLYHVPAAIRLKGLLNVDALERSFNEIVRRHEVLRTSFRTVEGKPAQVINPARALSPTRVDLGQLAADEREAEVFRLALEEARRPFNLSQAPLVRITLLRLSDDEHVVLLTMHHIASDGWSLGVFVREVGALYEAFYEGRPSPLPELPRQYADFAVWQRRWLAGAAGAQQLDYWRRQLAGAPETLELPTDRPRPSVQSFRGSIEPFQLSRALSDSLNAFSVREGATLFMTLLAAFNFLLYFYTKQETMLIGTDVANRSRGELEKLIGFFVNQLVLRADLSGNPSFRELLRRAKKTCLGAYEHQDMPFDKLVEELNPKRDLSRPVLFQVKLVLQNAPMPPLKLSHLALEPLATEPHTAIYDLLLDLGETPQGLRGAAHYSTDLFDAATIARLLRHYETLLQTVVARADVRVQELVEILSAQDEQERVHEEMEFAQARRSKLKNIKRKVIA